MQFVCSRLEEAREAGEKKLPRGTVRGRRTGSDRSPGSAPHPPARRLGYVMPIEPARVAD